MINKKLSRSGQAGRMKNDIRTRSQAKSRLLLIGEKVPLPVAAEHRMLEGSASSGFLLPEFERVFVFFLFFLLLQRS